MRILGGLLILAAIWFFATHVAWILNRKELIDTYGVAPYNWRILGFTALYLPYLRSFNLTKEGF